MINDTKRRVGVYVRNTIVYKRRNDLETKNLHTIIIDVATEKPMRIIAIYRTFNPQDLTTPRENFGRQLQNINTNTTNSTILIGDFNLDERKRFQLDYGQRRLFEDFEELVGHHPSSIYPTCHRTNLGKGG